MVRQCQLRDLDEHQHGKAIRLVNGDDVADVVENISSRFSHLSISFFTSKVRVHPKILELPRNSCLSNIYHRSKT